MRVSKAYVFPVPFGPITIEGLQFPKGDFGIGLSQVAELGLIPPNRSLNQLKALTGLSFQSHHKAKSELHPKAINAISLDDLEEIQKWALLQGNPAAIQLAVDCTGFTFAQMFADAVGIQMDAEERQNWWEVREETKARRRKETDGFQAHGIATNKNVPYAKWTLDLYSAAGLPRERYMKDKLSAAENIKLSSIEEMVGLALLKNPQKHPNQVIEEVVDMIGPVRKRLEGKLDLSFFKES